MEGVTKGDTVSNAVVTRDAKYKNVGHVFIIYDIIFIYL